jgi:hypothetical protein
MCVSLIKYYLLTELRKYNQTYRNKYQKRNTKIRKTYEPQLTFLNKFIKDIRLVKNHSDINNYLNKAMRYLKTLLDSKDINKLNNIKRQLVKVNGAKLPNLQLIQADIKNMLETKIKNIVPLLLPIYQNTLMKALSNEMQTSGTYGKLCKAIMQAIKNNHEYWKQYIKTKQDSYYKVFASLFYQDKVGNFLQHLLDSLKEMQTIIVNNRKFGRLVINAFDIYDPNHNATVLDWQRADIICNNVPWNKFCAGYSSSFMNYSPSQKLWLRSYFRHNESRIGHISTFIYNSKRNQKREVDFNLIKIFLRHASFYAHTTKKEEFIDYILKFANQSFLFKFINSIEYFAAKHKPQIILLKNRKHIKHVFEFIKDGVNVFSIATYPAIKIGSFGDPIKLAKPFYIIAHYKIKYDSKLKEPYCDQLYFDFDNLASIAKVNKTALQFFCNFFNETKKYPFDKEGTMRKNHAQKLKEYEEKEKKQWLERQIKDKYKIMRELI